MRTNILFMGVVIAAAGGLLTYAYRWWYVFTTGAGVANMILGLTTRNSTGVIVINNASNGPKLLVDKGVVRASIYELTFFPERILMKKLASVNVTVVLAIVLFLFGLYLDGLIGGLAGGLTGYSLQETLTQRNRERINNLNELGTVRTGDLEFRYDGLEKVRARRSSLLLLAKSGAVRVSLARGYVPKMKAVLKEVLREKYEEDPAIQRSAAGS